MDTSVLGKYRFIQMLLHIHDSVHVVCNVTEEMP